MKLTQLEVNEENLWKVLMDTNVYLVKFSEPKTKKEDGHKREMPKLPYGLSFKQLKSISVGELSELLRNNKAVIVKIEE